MTYVGKTLNFASRLGRWVEEGRLSDVAAADCLHVCGTEEDVFIGEYQRMVELRNQGIPLSNINESPGKAMYMARMYFQPPLW